MGIIRKTLLFIGYVLFSTLPVWACVSADPLSGNYEVREGQVYYRPYDKSYEQSSYVPVKGMDAATIPYLGKERGDSLSAGRGNYYDDYVLDKNHVYYQCQILEGVNPDEVVFLRQYFDQIVLVDELIQLVSSEDRRRRDDYLKDNERVYYFGRLLKDADGESFEWLPFHNRSFRQFNHDYVRDNQHIYLYRKLVSGDPNTANEIGYGYYSDAKHIYFRGEKLDGAFPDAFDLRGVFVISGDHVYYKKNSSH